jgi:Ca2+-binding RTX toxin-like protein
MGAALLLASRIALSEALTGTNGDDILHGSRERDTIADGNGNDKLFGGLGERVNPETPSP